MSANENIITDTEINAAFAVADNMGMATIAEMSEAAETLDAATEDTRGYWKRVRLEEERDALNAEIMRRTE
jgi:hypothetical protein